LSGAERPASVTRLPGAAVGIVDDMPSGAGTRSSYYHGLLPGRAREGRAASETVPLPGGEFGVGQGVGVVLDEDRDVGPRRHSRR